MKKEKPSEGAGEKGLYPTTHTCWIQDITFAPKLQVFFEKFFSKRRQKRTFGGTHKFERDFPGKVMKLCGPVSAGRQRWKKRGETSFTRTGGCVKMILIATDKGSAILDRGKKNHAGETASLRWKSKERPGRIPGI